MLEEVKLELNTRQEGRDTITTPIIKGELESIIIIVPKGQVEMEILLLQYPNITIFHDEASRQAFILGTSILSSNCIIDNTKGLFLESKLDAVDPSCFNYQRGSITIRVPETAQSWNFDLGGPDPEVTSPTFNVLVKLDVTTASEEIEIAEMFD